MEERPAENYKKSINSSGHVFIMRPYVYQSNCKLDVRYFPFDEQVGRIPMIHQIHSCIYALMSYSFYSAYRNVCSDSGHGPTRLERSSWKTSVIQALRTFMKATESGSW